MPLTFTITDNATDPPAVTVQVSGETGSTVRYYRSPVGGPPEWVLTAAQSSFSHPFPPTAFALAKGAWWVYAADNAAQSAPVLVLVTDGLDSVPTRCRAAIAARIVTLGLTDPDGGGPLPVVEQIYPDETGVSTLPCVILSNDGVQEGDFGGVNAFDDKGYPTRVGIVDLQGTPPDHRRLRVYERWRYAIERAFDGQRLPGVPESAYCRIEPYVIFDPKLPMMSHIVSGLLVRSVCRVPRGLNV